jgi:hypothetical protein
MEPNTPGADPCGPCQGWGSGHPVADGRMKCRQLGEQLGGQLDLKAVGGGIGIAQRLADDYPLADDLQEGLGLVHGGSSWAWWQSRKETPASSLRELGEGGNNFGSQG